LQSFKSFNQLKETSKQKIYDRIQQEIRYREKPPVDVPQSVLVTALNKVYTHRHKLLAIGALGATVLAWRNKDRISSLMTRFGKMLAIG
jgi:hypothetical protein